MQMARVVSSPGLFSRKKEREISRLIDNSLCLTSIAGDIIKKKNDEINKKIEVIRYCN